MSDIKLFRISNASAQELQGTSIAIEKTLQVLIETHLKYFLEYVFSRRSFPQAKLMEGA